MGKKHKHLYNQITTFENLWIASKNARRGKRNKYPTINFEYNLEENLFDIQEKLQNELYEFGEYNRFMIHEPKKREIASAPYQDRVVHHALCNIIEPILDKSMIYDSYACRVGKGSHRAIDKGVLNSNYVYKYKFGCYVGKKKNVTDTIIKSNWSFTNKFIATENRKSQRGPF